MNDEIAFSTAVGLAARIRSKEVSPVDAVEVYLARIEELNPRLGAYITIAGEQAQEAAHEAQELLAAGGDRPPFLGVPVAVKDLNETAGIRTTHGSRLFADHVPLADDAAVARMRAAGMIVIGKTNTPEFGWSFVTEPPGFAPARNPWNLDRTPGGSSGGAAGALAAGLCSIAQGSDAGGSIRVPAACCGLFGLKPARGRVSAAPNPAMPNWQNGPLARSVADAAALLDVLAGYEWGDPWWAAAPERPFSEEVGANPGRLRIAVSFDNVEVAEANVAAVWGAAKLMEDLGHTIVENAMPDGWTFSAPEAPSGPVLDTIAIDMAQYPGLPPLDEIDLAVLHPLNRLYLEAAGRARALDVAAVHAAAQPLLRGIVGAFANFDVLLTPVLAGPPLPVGAKADAEPMETLLEWLRMAPFTGTWNATGQPGVSVPFGFDGLGMPVGVQLVGRPEAEATLIRLASQIEQAQPWAQHRPSLT